MVASVVLRSWCIRIFGTPSGAPAGARVHSHRRADSTTVSPGLRTFPTGGYMTANAAGQAGGVQTIAFQLSGGAMSFRGNLRTFDFWGLHALR